MNRFIVNGRFTARLLTGQERVAIELILELDKIVKPNQVQLCIPEYAECDLGLANIEVVKFGKTKSHLWEQIDFVRYVLKHKATGLNLTTTAPLLRPDIIAIHDISYKVNPRFFTTMYGRISSIWHRFFYNSAKMFAKRIITVSTFCKNEISETYKIEPSRIAVLYNGWQHMNSIQSDKSIYDRYNSLNNKDFYFSLGSLAPNKNIQWILKSATMNPDITFAIAGKANLTAYGSDYSDVTCPNVLMLGYVSDGAMKQLMNDCRAFLFPSFYEGFGIPPLEAMSQGAEVVVSDIPPLREIFGDAATYIDPNTPCKINVKKTSDEAKQAVLGKFSWKDSARKLLGVIEEFNND